MLDGFESKNEQISF